MINNLLLFTLCLLLAWYVIPMILVPMRVISETVRAMREGERKIKRTLDNDNNVLEGIPESYRLFLDRNKFSFYGSFQYDQTEAEIWEQHLSNQPRRCFVLMKQSVPDFVTKFNEQFTLSSAGHNAAFLLPRPYGAFLQSKLTKDIEQLWQYHMEAEHFLIEQQIVEIPQVDTISIEESINQFTVNQGIYINKIPFFWLRAPYWYYIKRFQMLDVSIQEQITKRRRSS
jgi:hypothetical protein